MPLRVVLSRLAALAFLTLAAACAGSLDAEQSRLCRMLLPALFAQDDGITVIDSEAAGGRAVHITFRAGGKDAPERLLTCRFGGAGYSAAKRDLVAVLIDGVGLGESQLWFLKERWLESQVSVMSDPGPPRRGDGLLELPSRELATALQYALGGLPRLTLLALLALATALIYGLIGRINLAFGEFAAMGGMVASLAILLLAAVFPRLGLAIEPVALLVTLGTIALWGAVAGKRVLHPLAMRGGQPILVAGVGMMIAVQEGLRLAQGARNTWLPPVGEGSFALASGGGFEVMASPRALGIVAMNLLAIALLLLVMRRSRFGRAWRAIADDPEAAELLGLDPRRVLILSSLIATALAGLAGASVTLLHGGITFSSGTMMGLAGLMAAILGGVGSLGGAVLAGALIGMMQTLWMVFHAIEHWELASFTLLAAFLVLKPGGFFGYPEGPERRFRTPQGLKG